MRLLGIDVGTTSLSMALTDGDGTFLEAKTFPGEPLTKERTQDAAAIWERVREAMQAFPAPDAARVTRSAAAHAPAPSILLSIMVSSPSGFLSLLLTDGRKFIPL